MHCPNCSEKKLKVIDSRDRDREVDANSLIRRRECTACGYRFNTKEVVISVAYKSKPRVSTGSTSLNSKKTVVQKQKIQKIQKPKELDIDIDIASILDSI